MSESQSFRIATWNIHGALFPSIGATVGDTPNIDYIVSCLRRVNADVICLQETLFPEQQLSQGAAIATRLDMTLYERSSGRAHFEPTSRVGLTILSRYKIKKSEWIPLPNPNLLKEVGNGKILRSDEKIILRCEIDAPTGPFTLFSIHLLPLHKFSVLPDDVKIHEIMDRLQDEILDAKNGPTIVCGDFNLEIERLRISVPSIFENGRLRHLIRRGTRPDDSCHDNILITSPFTADDISVWRTFSDHHLCCATIRQPAEAHAERRMHGSPGVTLSDDDDDVLTVLHLSDLHFGDGEAAEVDWKDVPQLVERDTRRDQFVEVLSHLERRPDILVISGDITIAGRKSGYEVTERVINTIDQRNLLPLDRRRIVVTPGNHDVARVGYDDITIGDLTVLQEKRWKGFREFVWKRECTHPWLPLEGYIDRGDARELLKYAEEAMKDSENIWGGHLHRAASMSGALAVRLPFVYDRERRVFVYAFNSSSLSASFLGVDMETSLLLDFITRRTDSEYEKPRKLAEAYKRLLDIDPARIDGFELRLFEELLDMVRTKEGSRFESVTKIAVWHHHVAAVYTEEMKKFESLMNAGQIKRMLGAQGFHVVLHGHKHHNEAFMDSAVPGGGELLVISGGTIAGGPASGHAPGFYWIEFHRRHSFVEVSYIRHAENGSPRARLKRGLEGRERFRMPERGRRHGWLSPRERESGRKPIRLREHYGRTETGLVRRLLGADGSVPPGWAHELHAYNGRSTVGTAYGLRIMDLIGASHPRWLDVRDDVIAGLVGEQLDDGTWHSTSGRGSGELESTLWVLLALCRTERRKAVLNGLEGVEKLVREVLSSAQSEHVFSLSLALSVIARLSPSSDLVAQLSEHLIGSAFFDDDGNIVCWSARTLTLADNNEDPEPFVPSALHTSHAIGALAQAYKATNGRLGVGASALRGCGNWLMEHREIWDNKRETIHRSRSSRGGSLKIDHYCTPWALAALMQVDNFQYSTMIENEIASIIQGEDNGLWYYANLKRPIWATFDALHALTEYAFWSSSLPS